jgi:hypothetical protein
VVEGPGLLEIGVSQARGAVIEAHVMANNRILAVP